MKTKEQVFDEIRNSTNTFKPSIAANVKNIISFFEQYPQYDFLTADEVFFILASRKKNTVKVYDFGNGNIGFVGDIFDQTDLPLAGNFPNYEAKVKFSDFLEKATIIEELKKAEKNNE